MVQVPHRKFSIKRESFYAECERAEAIAQLEGAIGHRPMRQVLKTPVYSSQNCWTNHSF
jgi:hypothetical protein